LLFRVCLQVQLYAVISSAGLYGDDEPAWWDDRQRVKLDGGLNAGGVSGHVVPQRRLAFARSEGRTDHTRRRSLDFLHSLNEEHPKLHPDETELIVCIESYELAYRMQTEAMSVVDVDSEDAATREMCGLDDKLMADFGRNC